MTIIIHFHQMFCKYNPDRHDFLTARSAVCYNEYGTTVFSMNRLMHNVRWAIVLLGACAPLALRAGVLINEIMYDPPGSDDAEWLELHNTSNAAVSLAGWRVSEGVSFTFTPQHVIPANGYLVLARDAAAFTAVYPQVSCTGEFKGKLSNRGDWLALRNAGDEIVDLVYYAASSTWPRIAGDAGASLERSASGFPADSMAYWAPAHVEQPWYALSFGGPIKQPKLIVQLSVTGALCLDDIMITRADDTNHANLFPQGDFDHGTLDVRASGGHSARLSSAPAMAHSGTTCLLIEAARKSGYVQIALPAGLDKKAHYDVAFWVKPLGSVPALSAKITGMGKTVFALADEHWYGGTPGAPNTTPLAAAAGPAIVDLRHDPLAVNPLSPLTISAVVSGDAPASSVTVFHRTGTNGAFDSTPMTLDPMVPNTYRASLPGPANGTFYEYHVAAAGAGEETRYPNSYDAPAERRCYALESSLAPSVTVCAIWMDERRPGRRYPMQEKTYQPCTIVVNEEFYQRAGARYSGMFTVNSASKRSFNLKFARGMRPSLFDSGWQDSTAVLNAMAKDFTMLREHLSQELFTRAGVPAHETRYVRCYLNGRYEGLYLLMERVDGDYLDNHNLDQIGVIIRPDKHAGLRPDKAIVEYEADGVNATNLLGTFYSGIAKLPKRTSAALSNRVAHIRHYVELPLVQPYMAVNVILQQRLALIDNYYACCDTKTNQWLMLPWNHEMTWGWRPYGVKTDDTLVDPYFGSRAQQKAGGPVSKLNDAFFYPRSGTGSEISAPLRHAHLDMITNIIAAQFTSGAITAHVSEVAARIREEAALDIEHQKRGKNGLTEFDTQVNDLKTFINFRAQYLLQHDAEWR